MENKKLSSETLSVEPEQERLISQTTPELKGGLKRIKSLLYEDGELVDERHRWISVEEPQKLLLISGSTDDAKVLKELLSIKGYALESIVANGRKKIPTEFKDYSLVILNNASKKQLPASFLNKLEKHVRVDAGGLLLIGGPKSYGLGGYKGSLLEKMAPLEFLKPRTKKKRLVSAVALVIDKSRSMIQQGKIESAKRAALTSIEALKDDDYVSVIGFDSAPFVIIRMAKVKEVKPIASRRLRNLTAAGRTNLLPALAAARQALNRSGAGRKHIIILSDGKVPDAGTQYFSEIGRLRKAGVTVSTVALGSEADVPFMKVVSQRGNGAFYHTLDPSKLPQIFLRDIKVSVGEETIKEAEDFFVTEGDSGIYSTQLRSFPKLRGFVETKAKKAARLELVTKKEAKTFPILASWQYGLGKVIAFSSDANGRWSLPWLRWKNFVTFWNDLTKSAKPESGEKGENIDFDLRHSVKSEKLMLDLAIFDKSLAKKSAPTIGAKITSPGGGIKNVIFKQEKKGRFFAELPNARPGDYRVELSYGSLKLPVMGITLEAELFGEQLDRGINVSALNKIAFATSGSINPEAKALAAENRVLSEKRQLYIPLVILAFVLILIEAYIREIYTSKTS